jgi:glycosyltransferase involved in cell wall biosynthesis
MKLVVVIPAFNEERTIAAVVQRLPKTIPGVEAIEAVVIDDGSSDRTAAVARGTGATVISHRVNRGFGATFHTGMREALSRGADLIATIDADLQFSPEDVRPLIEALLARELDFVSCTRFQDPDNYRAIPWVKRWGNRVVTRLVNRIAGTAFTESSCGFRAYRRDAVLRLNLWSDFDYAQEALIKLSKAGFRLGEVSLKVRGQREFGQSKIASNVVRFGVRCAQILLYTMRDLRPLRFFGSIALALFAVGFLLGAFVLAHWLRTGMTYPYTSFLFGSATGLILGFLLAVFALLADMIGRQGRVLEEIWYWNRRDYFAEEQAKRKPGRPGVA